MDRVGDIGLFLRVLDLGSISAAARSLDISVAVASQRLQRLEKELGVRLLHRTTRRLSATPEGAALAERGRGLVEDLEALTTDLRQSGAAVAGTLRMTASASFGPTQFRIGLRGLRCSSSAAWMRCATRTVGREASRAASTTSRHASRRSRDMARWPRLTPEAHHRRAASLRPWLRRHPRRLVRSSR